MREALDLTSIGGSIPAIPTPFVDGEIDTTAFGRILSHVIDGRSSAIVVAGSTGEGASLGPKEYSTLVGQAVEHSTNTPVIAGVGAASTQKAIDLVVAAETAGADGLLISTPYYVRATDEGVICHYMAIAAATSLPIILYNVPSRTGYDTPSDVILHLSMKGYIAGLKESADNVGRVQTLRKAAGRHFAVFCGDDIAALKMAQHGSIGSISVVANIVPDLYSDIHARWTRGDIYDAAARFTSLEPLIGALMQEPNPQGVKYALSLLGLCRSELRLPLLQVSSRTAIAIERAMSAIPSLSDRLDDLTWRQDLELSE